MSKYIEKTLSLGVSKTYYFAFALGVSVFLPFFIHLQWFTGPLINALLIIVLFVSGIRLASTLSIVPSIVALSSGLLPIPLAPMVPFIILSNLIFVYFIDYIYNRIKDGFNAYWTACITSSFLKFLVLLLSSYSVAKILHNQVLLSKILTVFGWMQFVNAILGSVIAWLFLRWLKRL